MSTRDILDKIANDARRLRVARNLPEGKLSWEWICRVRDDFRRFKDEQGLSLGQLSKRMGKGFSASVLSQFASLEAEDEYIGDIDRIVRGVNQAMETYVRSQEVVRPTGFVETAVANRMLNAIQLAIETRSIGVIWSDAGRGKTMTLKAAAQIFQGSILVRVCQPTRSMSGLARAIASELCLRGCRTTYQIQERVIDLLKESGRAIMIDEAHRLNMEALEFLRDVHDECGVPIILAGTQDINAKVTDTAQWYGQFNRRISVRYDVTEDHREGGAGGGGKAIKPLHSVAEIKKLFSSDKLRLTDDGAATLCRLGNLLGLGGLGLCNQVMLLAQRLAKNGVVDAPIVLRVMRRIHGVEQSRKQVERQLEESKLQIA